jgi:hypothetical protein
MMASATRATGLTVGCRSSRFPSAVARENEFAPGYANRSPFLRLESLYSVAVGGSFAIRLQVSFALSVSSIRRSTTMPVGLPP